MTRTAFAAVLGTSSMFVVVALCVACGNTDNGVAPTSAAEIGGTPGSGGATSTSGVGGAIGNKTQSNATGGTTQTSSNGSGGSSANTTVQGGSSAKGDSSSLGGSSTAVSTTKGGSSNAGGSSTRGGSSSTASTTKGGSSSTSAGAVGGSSSTAAGGSSTTPPSTDPLIGGVSFSTPSQTFKNQIEVGMSTGAAGAEIRYTVDGKLPTSSSTLYAGTPVTFKATTQVRAQAFVGGQASGSVSTGIYIARTIDATSDIPIMIVESYGKPKPCDKNVDIDAAIMIWEPVNGTAAMASLPTLVARAGYHARGQSSLSFAQTPYKLEFWDNSNKDLDYPVLGMPSDSDWALIAPFYDRTLIRNPFVYTLGKEMGMQAPRTAYAEVYINQTTHAVGDTEYEGIYWVSETIKNNKVRTNLKQLEEKDTDTAKLSGGYIFKFDQAAAEEPKIVCTGSNPVKGFGSGGLGGGAIGGGGVTTPAVKPTTTACTMPTSSFPTSTGTAGTCWMDLEVVDPDPLIAQQKTWLTDYIQTFHNSLHASPIGDYAASMDLASFIDYLLISELTRNVDAYVRSAYFYKDRDQKLMAGPLWDYNFALGGVGAQVAAPTSSTDSGWQYTGTSRNVNNWYPKLTGDPKFMAEVKARYTELRKTLWTDASLKQRMDTLSAPLKNAVVRDFKKWPVSGVITSSTGFTGGPTTPTWEGQLQVMRDFVTARLAWMDANLK